MKKDKIIISGMTVASFLLTGVAAKATTFQMDDVSGIKIVKADDKKEGTCGEGKCGEGQCGKKDEKKDGKEGKCGEGKCGEGTCGSKEEKKN